MYLRPTDRTSTVLHVQAGFLCARCYSDAALDSNSDFLIDIYPDCLGDLERRDESIGHSLFQGASVRPTAHSDLKVRSVDKCSCALSFEHFVLEGPSLYRAPISFLPLQLKGRSRRLKPQISSSPRLMGCVNRR
jgi:hypothetical protein